LSDAVKKGAFNFCAEERTDAHAEEIRALIVDVIGNAFTAVYPAAVQLELARHARLETFQNQERVFSQGRVGNKLYLMATGRVKQTKKTMTAAAATTAAATAVATTAASTAATSRWTRAAAMAKIVSAFGAATKASAEPDGGRDVAFTYFFRLNSAVVSLTTNE
jgi:Lon protease-like protein